MPKRKSVVVRYNEPDPNASTSSNRVSAAVEYVGNLLTKPSVDRLLPEKKKKVFAGPPKEGERWSTLELNARTGRLEKLANPADIPKAKKGASEYPKRGPMPADSEKKKTGRRK